MDATEYALFLRSLMHRAAVVGDRVVWRANGDVVCMPGGGGGEDDSEDAHESADDQEGRHQDDGQGDGGHAGGGGGGGGGSGARGKQSKEERLAMMAERKEGQQQMKATLMIQSARRGKKERSDYKETKQAVVVIQSSQRGRSDRKEMNAKQAAAKTIQAGIRKRIEKRSDGKAGDGGEGDEGEGSGDGSGKHAGEGRGGSQSAAIRQAQEPPAFPYVPPRRAKLPPPPPPPKPPPVAPKVFGSLPPSPPRMLPPPRIPPPAPAPAPPRTYQKPPPPSPPRQPRVTAGSRPFTPAGEAPPKVYRRMKRLKVPRRLGTPNCPPLYMRGGPPLLPFQVDQLFALSHRSPAGAKPGGWNAIVPASLFLPEGDAAVAPLHSELKHLQHELAEPIGFFEHERGQSSPRASLRPSARASPRPSPRSLGEPEGAAHATSNAAAASSNTPAVAEVPSLTPTPAAASKSGEAAPSGGQAEARVPAVPATEEASEELPLGPRVAAPLLQASASAPLETTRTARREARSQLLPLQRTKDQHKQALLQRSMRLKGQQSVDSLAALRAKLSPYASAGKPAAPRACHGGGVSGGSSASYTGLSLQQYFAGGVGDEERSVLDLQQPGMRTSAVRHKSQRQLGDKKPGFGTPTSEVRGATAIDLRPAHIRPQLTSLSLSRTGTPLALVPIALSQAGELAHAPYRVPPPTPPSTSTALRPSHGLCGSVGSLLLSGTTVLHGSDWADLPTAISRYPSRALTPLR